MSIQIVSTPNAGCPTPVHGNCVEFCFLEDDLITQQETQATYIALFLGTSNVDGEIFEVNGVKYLVDNSAPFTGNSMQFTGANGGQQAQNFADMLNVSFYTKGKVTTVVNQFGTFGFVVVTYNEGGLQSPWNFDATGLSNAPFFIPTNGLELEVRDYDLVYQLFCSAPREAICNSGAVKHKVVDGATQEVCIDFSEDLKSILSFDLPEHSQSTILLAENIKKQVEVCYGFLETNEALGCQKQSGEFEFTDSFTVINAARPINQLTEFLPCFNGFGGLGYPFMTDRPSGLGICKDEYAWLHLCAEFNTLFGGGGTTYDYLARYETIDELGATNTIDLPLTTTGTDGVLMIPAGTSNPVLSGTPLASYTVQVFAIQQPANVEFPLSEAKEFYVKECCCPTGEFYFVNSYGVVDTLKLECIERESVNVSYSEYCLPIECKGSYNDRLTTGGLQQTNTKAYDEFAYKLTLDRTPNAKEYLKQFMTSSNRWIKELDKQGNTIMRKVLLNSDTTNLFEKGQLLELEITGRYHTDLAIVSS